MRGRQRHTPQIRTARRELDTRIADYLPTPIRRQFALIPEQGAVDGATSSKPVVLPLGGEKFFKCSGTIVLQRYARQVEYKRLNANRTRAVFDFMTRGAVKGGQTPPVFRSLGIIL